jgi:cobalamin biosynthesis Co2+ chelatase CbiK
MLWRYFYKLSRSKETWKRVIGYLYFVIGEEYHNFIRKITKYYPFSLLYKNRLFHAANKPYSDFMWEIEEAAKEKEIDIRVWNGHGFKVIVPMSLIVQK